MKELLIAWLICVVVTCLVDLTQPVSPLRNEDE